MSPATLYREGTDLDGLLADLDQQYPGQVRVVSIAHPREGGVLGFFAKQRVGVHYRLTGGGATGIDDAPAPDGFTDTTTDGSPDAPPRFAEVLAELASRRGGHAGLAEDRAADGAAVDTVELSHRIPELEYIDEIPNDTPTAASPVTVSRAYAKIQARADAAAARIATDLTADPASGFTAALPQAVPAQREHRASTRSTVQPLMQWPTDRRRTPRALPMFRPLTEQAGEPRAVRWPRADGGFGGPDPIPELGTLPGWSPKPEYAAAHGPEPATLPTMTRTASLGWTIGSTAPDGVPTGPATQPAAVASPSGATLQRQLTALGIDPTLVPQDVTHAFSAIDRAVATLPEAPEPPTGPGQILVVAGPARDAATAADILTADGVINQTWYYGCPGRADAFTTADHAAQIAADARDRASGPVLIVVGTAGPAWTGRARGVIEAATADALWAVVDATVKVDDARAALRRLGDVDALIVCSAEYSASPATVWGLDKPIALLDGRPATTAGWTALLMGKLAEQGRACSDAPH